MFDAMPAPIMPRPINPTFMPLSSCRWTARCRCPAVCSSHRIQPMLLDGKQGTRFAGPGGSGLFHVDDAVEPGLRQTRYGNGQMGDGAIRCGALAADAVVRQA